MLKGVCVIFAGTVLTSRVPATITAVPQAKLELQITEPSSGSIANPGQVLTVKVSSPTPALFPEVALIGEHPIGFAGTISSLPGEISVAIPKDIALGRHTLTVGGTPKLGREPVFAAIEIDVERPDLPVSMSTTMSGIEFDSPGEQIRLDVLAEFLDRSEDAFTSSTYRATESSRISFSSANTDVATVDPSGQVTAVAPGVGEIRVKYALGEHKLSIGIPVGMRNPDEETSMSKFSFSIAPGFQKIEPGGSASFKVSVSSYTKFQNEIEFSAHGLPEGATASFTPVSVHATESATLTISTLASTTLDTYTIFITGKSGKLNPTASVLLIVATDDKK